MRTFVPRRLLAAALFCAAIAGAGCLSPTLPLPPPESPESIQQRDDGTWLVSGTCSPGALVSLIRDRDGVGVVVEDRDANGHYVIAIAAQPCDLLLVWQTDGVETSATQRVVLQETQNGRPVDSAECVNK